MKAALSILALATAATVAATAGEAQTQPRQRITRIVIYGNDPCPRGAQADDIVICARRPNNERYRIPRELRDEGAEDDPESTSWAARAQSLEYAGRTGIQSCSTVGPGGFTGCWAELMRAARNDRRVEGEAGR
jgi:hypothetical protein